jgi:hypothetical protein
MKNIKQIFQRKIDDGWFLFINLHTDLVIIKTHQNRHVGQGGS